MREDLRVGAVLALAAIGAIAGCFSDLDPSPFRDGAGDDAGDSDVSAGECGNGSTETDRGEQCDLGSSVNCDLPGCTCTTACLLPWVVEREPGAITWLTDVWTDGVDAVAVGRGGVVLRRDAEGHWAAETSRTTEDLNTVEALSMAGGTEWVAAGTNSKFIHWTEPGGWEDEPGLVPPGDPVTINDLACWESDPPLCMMATQQGLLFTYVMAWYSWPEAAGNPWNAVAYAVEDTHVYGFAVGQGGQVAVYSTFPARAWSDEEMPISAFNVYDVWMETRQSAFLVADSGRIHYFNGGTYDLMDTPTGETLRGVSGTGNLVFAVGDDGTVLRLDRGAATPEWIAEPTFTSLGLRAVAAGPTLVLAVGENGIILRRPL